ncbi:MAG: hypothetical protein BWK80_04875 [Desulfobacteraceae bacterium IS3]|nr:MAG: hypothetical protein BWK80_04875 [Desulfobacteraceae bacterium IS3]
MENLHISDNKDKETVNRRQFLIRAGKAGISVADACSVRYCFYDPAVPVPSSDRQKSQCCVLLPEPPK